MPDAQEVARCCCACRPTLAPPSERASPGRACAPQPGHQPSLSPARPAVPAGSRTRLCPAPSQPHLVWLKLKLPGEDGGQACLFFLAARRSPSRQLSRKPLSLAPVQPLCCVFAFKTWVAWQPTPGLSPVKYRRGPAAPRGSMWLLGGGGQLWTSPEGTGQLSLVSLLQEPQPSPFPPPVSLPLPTPRGRAGPGDHASGPAPIELFLGKGWALAWGTRDASALWGEACSSTDLLPGPRTAPP